jgi:hypothetical protein
LPVAEVEHEITAGFGLRHRTNTGAVQQLVNESFKFCHVVSSAPRRHFGFFPTMSVKI